MPTFCQCLYHRKCQRRGVGGQKKLKSCQRSLWTAPYLIIEARIENVHCLEIYNLNLSLSWKICNQYCYNTEWQSNVEFSRLFIQNLHWKLGQQTPKLYFFRNKTFLFFKIESWQIQHLFEKEFRETSQNFNSFSSFR